MPWDNQTRTRASQPHGSDHMPSHEELIKLNGDVMSLTKQARDYLERQGYMLKDVQGNRMTLVHMLFLLSHCTPNSFLLRGICAVATILENEAAMRTADAVTANISKRIDPLLELVKEVTDNSQGVMTETRK